MRNLFHCLRLVLLMSHGQVRVATTSCEWTWVGHLGHEGAGNVDETWILWELRVGYCHSLDRC